MESYTNRINFRLTYNYAADTYRGVGLTALRNAMGVSMFFAFVTASADVREQVSNADAPRWWIADANTIYVSVCQ